jgi:hypothetical protein
MKSWMVLILISGLLSGCENPVQDFVNGGSEAVKPEPVAPIAGSGENLRGVGLSPGAVSATGSNVSGRLVLKSSLVQAKGPNVDAVLSIDHQHQ